MPKNDLFKKRGIIHSSRRRKWTVSAVAETPRVRQRYGRTRQTRASVRNAVTRHFSHRFL